LERLSGNKDAERRASARVFTSPLSANRRIPRETVSARSLPALPLAVLMSLVALTFWLNQFVQAPSTRADGNMRHDPDLIVESFTAQALSPAGEIQYTVKAAKMSHFPDDDSSLLDTVVFTAFNPSQPPIIARAPRGRLIAGGDEVIMEGGVVVTSEKTEKHQPLRLSTPALNVFPDQNIARSTEGVQLDSPTGQLTANKLELNSLTRQMRLERGRAKYQQPQLKPI
jgi:lipopolysaccharide export system protein LptC